MSGPAGPAANDTCGKSGSVQALADTFWNSSGTYELPAAAPAALVSRLIFRADVTHVRPVVPGRPLEEFVLGWEVPPPLPAAGDPAAAVDPHALSVIAPAASDPAAIARTKGRGPRIRRLLAVGLLPCTTLPAQSRLCEVSTVFRTRDGFGLRGRPHAALCSGGRRKRAAWLSLRWLFLGVAVPPAWLFLRVAVAGSGA